MKEYQYKIEITMPSGEKLPVIPVDGNAFLLASANDIGASLAGVIARIIEQRLKA